MRVKIFKSILEVSKGVSHTVGIAFLLIIGLASWAEVPLLLYIAYDDVPYSLTFNPSIGLVFIAIAFITAGWYLYGAVRDIIGLSRNKVKEVKYDRSEIR